MSTVVEISDNEDADDCVMNSEVIVVDDEIDETASELYQEARKENQLLADFIEKCLKLENSIGMQKILKEKLLKTYYESDKTARESPRIQKNFRRANYLLQIDPQHKFSHIKDLCTILQAIRAKKRVPFVTLTTNLTDNNRKPDTLKRGNTEQLEVTDMSKKAKLDSYDVSPFSETNGVSFNDTCDTIDESISLGTCSQQSAATEEDRLLVPQRESPNVPTSMEKKLKAIESKIAYYKKKIAVLDEQEVDDDSVNSAYIKCERLKIKVVSLYKERCQLIGSQPVKHKGIRLKLAEGRPPGPTKVLERFLNKNCNKDGDPPFPDFCDVVTCVTEANEKDDLGWTKAQIMNEASALFTLCGRALQKRRQNREYRDLLYKVKMEALETDPADEDPQLRAKLEENKRIAVKKESDLLERYTMLQLAAPKSKSQKNITAPEKSGEGNNSKVSDKVDAQQKLIHNNNHNMESIVLSIDESEKSNDSANLKSNDTNSIDKSNLDADAESQDESQSIINESSNMCGLMDADNEKRISPPPLVQNVEMRIDALEYSSNDKDCYVNEIQNIVISTGHENKLRSNNIICNNDNKLEGDKLNISKNTILPKESTEKVKHKLDAMEMFKSLGNNFTVTVEILSDS